MEERKKQDQKGNQKSLTKEDPRIYPMNRKLLVSAKVRR